MVYYREHNQVPYLDISVYPLKADAYHTTGLCGNYNLDATDDQAASASSCATNCEVHRHEKTCIII